MIDHSQDYTCDHGEPHPCPMGCPETDAARTERLLATVRDGAWLDQQDFPPLHYAVPGVVPEGFTLLVGPPKAGKSWLALAILLAVASGGRAFGRIDVAKGRVLYLALEDGDRRMQDRCRVLLGSRYRPDEPIPGDFHYVTRVPAGEAVALIEAFLTRHPDTALVVVDTLGKVMPAAMPNETTYQRDYRVGGRLKAIVDSRPGLALVVLHHDRKAGSDDFVERVSGTNGLAGAADTVVVLSRARQAAEGTLAVTGRDVEEGEYALTMSEGSWTLAADTLDGASAVARQRAATAGVGDDLVEIIEYVGEHPEGIGPTAVATALELDPVTVRKYLSRAVESGRLLRPRRGVYTPVTSVTSRREHSMHGDDVTVVTPPIGGLEDQPLWGEDES